MCIYLATGSDKKETVTAKNGLMKWTVDIRISIDYIAISLWAGDLAVVL